MFKTKTDLQILDNYRNGTNDGYMLSGDSQLTCESDGSDADGIGQWDGDKPRCNGIFYSF